VILVFWFSLLTTGLYTVYMIAVTGEPNDKGALNLKLHHASLVSLNCEAPAIGLVTLSYSTDMSVV
jgi:hypothetical protein